MFNNLDRELPQMERTLAAIFADSFATRADDCVARGDWGDACAAYAKAGDCHSDAGYASRARHAYRMAHRMAIIAEVESLGARLDVFA